MPQQQLTQPEIFELIKIRDQLKDKGDPRADRVHQYIGQQVQWLIDKTKAQTGRTIGAQSTFTQKLASGYVENLPAYLGTVGAAVGTAGGPLAPVTIAAGAGLGAGIGELIRAYARNKAGITTKYDPVSAAATTEALMGVGAPAAEAVDVIASGFPKVGVAQGVVSRITGGAAARGAIRSQQMLSGVEKKVSEVGEGLPVVGRIAGLAEKQLPKEIPSPETLKASQARLSSLAKQAAQEAPRNPIDAARSVVSAMQGVKRATDIVENNIYPMVQSEATKAGIKVSLADVSAAVNEALSPSLAASKSTGISALPTAVGGKLSTMAERMSPEAAINRFAQILESTGASVGGTSERSLQGMLTKNQVEILQKVSQNMEASGAGSVDFATADEANRGLQSLIRSLKASRNPEYQNAIRTLSNVQKTMQASIDKSLEGHPDIAAIYKTAKGVTLSQHEATDPRSIKNYFYQATHDPEPAERILNAVLMGGKYTLPEDIANALRPTPETFRALDLLNREGASPKLAANLLHAVGDSIEAKENLRKVFTNEMMRQTNNDPAKMISWLTKRTGARVLIGEQTYDNLLRVAKQEFDSQLKVETPAADAFLKKLAGVSSNYDVLANISKDTEYAKRVADLAGNDQKLRSDITRGVLNQIVEDATTRLPGGRAVFNPLTFSKDFTRSYASLRQFSNHQALDYLKDMSEAANYASMAQRKGALIRMYQRVVGFGGSHLYITDPITGQAKMPLGPKELADATQNPELAKAMRDAARFPISSPKARQAYSRLMGLLGGASQFTTRDESEENLP